MRQEISNSEMGTFRTCRARHGFEYQDLLRPKLPARVLKWGNTIHAGIEAGYLGAFNRTVVEGVLPHGLGTHTTEIVECGGMSRLERAHMLGSQGVSAYHGRYLERLDALVRDGTLRDAEAQVRFEDAKKLLDVAAWAVAHYFDATQRDLDRLVPLAFELPFRVPVPNENGRNTGLYLKGKIDGVWWDPEGQQVLVDDHKTVDELLGTTEKRIAIDPQMSGYLYAVGYLIRTGRLVPMDGSALPEGAWERVGACRYNVIRRRRPSQPKVNKVRKNDGMHTQTAELADLEKATGAPCGLVSTAAIDTTYEIYREALSVQVNGRALPVTEKQTELANKLQDQGDRYFARFEFWRNAATIERWRQEVRLEARLMREAERLPVMRTRNPGACTQANSMPCAFRAVCLDDAPETRALYRIAGVRHEEVNL